MTEVRDRRRVAASPRDVWKMLGENERDGASRWTPHVRWVDRPAALGAVYEEHGRGPLALGGPTRWRIVEFDAPRRQVHRAEDGRLTDRLHRIFELASDGDGGTWLTLGLRYEPTLGVAGRWLDRALLRRMHTRRIARSLDVLARAAARREPPPHSGPTAVR